VRRSSLRTEVAGEDVGVADPELGHLAGRNRTSLRKPSLEAQRTRCQVGTGEPDRCRTGRGHCECPVGEPEHERPHRSSLPVIGVQEAFAGAKAYQGELPAEVGGVLDASVHALRPGRAVDVRRVPREEHRPRPVRLGLAVADLNAVDHTGVSSRTVPPVAASTAICSSSSSTGPASRLAPSG
jgi:hypothetical protein